MEALNSNASPSPRSLQGSLQRRTRFWLWAGFGGLLSLMCLLGGLAVSSLYQLEIRQNRIRQDYIQRDRLLQALRANIYLSGTYVRDFLLDTAEPMSPSHRLQFFEKRRDIGRGLEDYGPLISPATRPHFQELKNELQSYLATMGSVFDWSAAERRSRSSRFVEAQVLPRRLQVLGLADRIQQLSEQQSEISSQAVGETLSSFRLRLAGLLGLTVSLGLLLAGTTLWRILNLEKESSLRFEEVMSAREESKRLAGDLLLAQENERRRISRELHDEVGQVLYATMLGLGNLRSSLNKNDLDESLRQLQGVEEMSSRTVNVVRNISLLLRPAMLDDVGLVPALKWLAREVSRTHSVPVDVFTDLPEEDLPEKDLPEKDLPEKDLPEEHLPEEHRTCVYRVVQEAIHNAVKHAGATRISVNLKESASGRLQVQVKDDGKGFEPERETGVGILGMEERILQLGGILAIESVPGRGTTVSFELPRPKPWQSLEAGQEIRPLRTA